MFIYWLINYKMTMFGHFTTGDSENYKKKCKFFIIFNKQYRLNLNTHPRRYI